MHMPKGVERAARVVGAIWIVLGTLMALSSVRGVGGHTQAGAWPNSCLPLIAGVVMALLGVALVVVPARKD
jgi:hypothetical protein